MKLNEEFLPYLRGSQFSNSLHIPYSYNQAIPDRVSFLRDLANGKKVLHLGCLDHLPLIDDKVKRRQWLHKELTEVASACIGIDIDEETSNYVKAKYGCSNILLGDFTSHKFPEVMADHWDYAILGELLEHIDNPVAFLAAIRNNYAGIINKIVITVPNAWNRTAIRGALESKEIINSDHRYWFTPYTLSKVMHHAGIELDEIYFANRVPLTKWELIKRKISMVTGSTPEYNFTYASSIVALGRI
jgi:hypothetical protein